MLSCPRTEAAVTLGNYLRRWALVPDGDPIVTRTSRLLSVRRDGEPAMLKLTTNDEERLGGTLMQWWGSDGAARVLARDDHALLLERAMGSASLADFRRPALHGPVVCDFVPIDARC